MPTKVVEFTCTRCNTSKPTDQFRKDPSVKRGFRSVCKACNNKKPDTKRDVNTVASLANRNAIMGLIERHEREFKNLVITERRKLGLDGERWITLQ